MTLRSLLLFVSPLTLLAASCGEAATGENAPPPHNDVSFKTEKIGQFDEPWAMAIDTTTGIALVTEKKGALKMRMPDGQVFSVGGVPEVDYGGQGGFGDVVFAPIAGGEKDGAGLAGRTVYLSWVEAGGGDTRGAVVGRASLTCEGQTKCNLGDLKVIWRQQPKVSGRGHFSHRLAFSPDGQYIFISSGERQKMEPAQDISNNLGTIVRLLPDGTSAPGNPFADKPAPTNQIWSYGHRNVLGLAFDDDGVLWDLEHGPAGGDEINLVEPGKNYGWPLVSDGDHYDGKPIPRHLTRPDLAAPAISWNPVIAPGDFIFYSGNLFPGWKGRALIASFTVPGLVQVHLKDGKGTEEARYPMDNRMREIAQAPDGSVWMLEDGPSDGSGALLRLTPTAPETTN